MITSKTFRPYLALTTLYITHHVIHGKSIILLHFTQQRWPNTLKAVSESTRTMYIWCVLYSCFSCWSTSSIYHPLFLLRTKLVVVSTSTSVQRSWIRIQAQRPEVMTYIIRGFPRSLHVTAGIMAEVVFIFKQAWSHKNGRGRGPHFHTQWRLVVIFMHQAPFLL